MKWILFQSREKSHYAGIFKRNKLYRILYTVLRAIFSVSSIPTRRSPGRSGGASILLDSGSTTEQQAPMRSSIYTSRNYILPPEKNQYPTSYIVYGQIVRNDNKASKTITSFLFSLAAYRKHYARY